jgi:hypothetical protein
MRALAPADQRHTDHPFGAATTATLATRIADHIGGSMRVVIEQD